MEVPPPAERTQNDLPDTKRTKELRGSGVTLRAVLIGAVLVPVLCWWTLYSEIVAQSTELGVMSLSVGVIFALLILLLLNGVLKRFMPRWALHRAELIFIYIMQTTSIAISGVGMMQFLHISLANVSWYASPENGWAEKYHPLLKSWAFPDPKSLRGYYLGQTTFFTQKHLAAMDHADSLLDGVYRRAAWCDVLPERHIAPPLGGTGASDVSSDRASFGVDTVRQ